MFRYWPLPVEFKTRSTFLSLSKLSPADKGKVWAEIRAEQPALADLILEIRANSDLQELIKMTNAEICIENKFTCGGSEGKDDF